jgi:hypothetical protein
MRKLLITALMLAFLAMCDAPLISGEPKKSTPAKKNLKSRYAIAVANSFYNKRDKKWLKVVDKLKEKYSAKVFKFAGRPDASPTLKKEFAEYRPHYVCFVSKPRQCGGEFVKSVIRFMSTIDNDPYDDAVWAILTGYTADDALKIVNAKPLKVKRHLSHFGSGALKWFESGVSFSEGKKFDKWEKKKGKPVKKVRGPADTTQQWVSAVNKNKVDIITTSGHATVRDWKMGYSYKSGRIVPAGRGRLMGASSTGRRFSIKTSNPKIYAGIGNCWIANIPSKLMDCMCLSWIHNGAYHFFGHVEPQARSCTATWGIRFYFFALQDAYTFSEAVFANRIGSRYVLNNHSTGKQRGWPRCLNITVLYGDPAWDTRMKRATDLVYDMKLDVKDADQGRKKITFTVTVNIKGKIDHPPVAILPFFISNWSVEKSNAAKTVVADNFILLDLYGKEYKKGEKITATITCKKEE